ncbi:MULTISPECIES: phosphotransferase [unclassified Shewanella]|uniref:phosphotransferase n=1 Tax=unclassified Shewanella TaxID=196818 RepID=UPI00354C0B6D
MKKFNPWSVLPASFQRLLPSNFVTEISSHCIGVTKLSAGLSNSNYRLHMLHQDWVLRDNKNVQQWCDRDNEVICWQMVEAVKLAPKLIWKSANKQFYLSEFIKQDRFDWSSIYSENGFNSRERPVNSVFHLNPISQSAEDQTLLKNKQQQALDPVEHLLKLLCELSRLPLPPKVISLTQQWQVYLESLTTISQVEKNQQWQSSFRQLKQRQVEMNAWLADLESCLIAPQFCHRDLSPYNLLFCDDKLQCIDFEYCAASHPMFDLASVLTTHQLTSHQVTSLCKQYFAEQPNLKAGASQYVRQIINCFWMFAAAWALMMAGTEVEDTGKEAEAPIVGNKLTDIAEVKASYFTLFNKYLSLIS